MSGIKVCVVTGSRAEFGQLLPLLHKLNEDVFFDLDLVVKQLLRLKHPVSQLLHAFRLPDLRITAGLVWQIK